MINSYRLKNHKVFPDVEIKKLLTYYNRLKKSTCFDETTKETNILFVRDLILKANFRFIYRTALIYHQKYHVPVEDLIGYGVQGLITGIDRYEESSSLNNVFMTYAVFWIKQGILSNVKNHETLIRIPIHKHMQIETKLKDLRKEKDHKSIDDLLTNLTMITTASSLDMKVNYGDNKKETLSNFVRDEETSYYPEKRIKKNQCMTILRKYIKELSADEQLIVKKYYGIDQEYSEKLPDIAEHFNAETQTIRFRKGNALKKAQKQDNFGHKARL